MHRLLRISAPVISAASLALLASPAGAATQSVKLRFAAVAGETPVSCGTPITGLGTTNATAQLQDLRFYVSGVQLLRKGGKATTVKVKANQLSRVAGPDSVTLIDLENAAGSCRTDGTPTTNAVVLGTVPKGTYTGVRFTLGVPFSRNHTNTIGAPAPLGLAAMAWSWQSGRKFTKIELVDPAGGAGTWTAKAFMIHLGSTGCTGNPATGETVACKAPNRSTITLKTFNPARQDVALDLQALLAANDITKNGGGAPGCMSGPTDPECPGIFGALGVSWSPDGSGTGQPTGMQTAFRAIDR